MADKTRAKEHTEVSEAQIAVHWKEEEYFQPPKKFIEQANMKDQDTFASGSVRRISPTASRNTRIC